MSRTAFLKCHQARCPSAVETALLVNAATDGRVTFRDLAALPVADDILSYEQLPKLPPEELAARTEALLTAHSHHGQWPDCLWIASPEFYGRDLARLSRRIRRLGISLDVQVNISNLVHAIGLADHIHVPTETYRQAILHGPIGEKFPALRDALRSAAGEVHVLPYGGQDQFFGPEDGLPGKGDGSAAFRASQGLMPKTSRPLVLVSTRLADQKRPDLLLAALSAALRQKVAQGIVWLAAEPGAEAAAPFLALRDQYPEDLSVSIGSTPSIPRLRAGYHAADVFLFPSDPCEPQGLTPLQAWAGRAIVLGRPAGIVGDLQGEVYGSLADLLVVKASTDIEAAYSAALCELCDWLRKDPRNAELNALRGRGWKGARRRTWSGLANDYLSMFGVSS